MDGLNYKDSILHIEGVSAKKIAEQFGTPCYVYSHAVIEKNCRIFKSALAHHPHLICYAVKANSNLGILNLIKQHGLGFDIVSQGELERVLAAGGHPEHIIFSGVGKKEAEIARALHVGIACFNVESEPELHRIQEVAAQQKKIARISLRINPNIDAKTHPYIATGLHENKFGIEADLILTLCQQIKKMPNIELIGIGSHIGSQLTTLEPFIEAADFLINMAQQIEKENIVLQTINLGGGLGIIYQNESPPSADQYLSAIYQRLGKHPYKIILEPGRALIGQAGTLLTQIEYLKQTPQKNFAIVDAGMNDFIRPALYQAWHLILPVEQHTHIKPSCYDIVGPVCESADFLGQTRELSIKSGDLLAINSVGAYGFSMASNYNSRPRPAEILIKDKTLYLLRERESFQDLFLHENKAFPWILN